MKTNPSVRMLVALVLITFAVSAKATDFSFAGMFVQDDNVQTFSFVVPVTSTVTLRTWSYAGGVNAMGQTIASDGFDPILAVFNSMGALIDQNDDGGASVPPDPETGRHFDTFLQTLLAPGVYTTTVMQYNNFAIGPNLSNGFTHMGDGNFTSAAYGGGGPGGFYDVTGDQNDGHWAFDILNVGSATTTVPDFGSTVVLFALAFATLCAWRRALKTS